MNTIKEKANDLQSFHSYELIPFKKTSMTIPFILYHAINAKLGDPKKYFAETAVHIKDSILTSGVSEKDLSGKLSTKIQEFAWCEIISSVDKSDIELTQFKKAKLIPYGNGKDKKKTMMTLPAFLFDLIVDKFDGDNRKAVKYIKEKASNLRSKIIEANPEKTPYLNEEGKMKDPLRGKVSHKIQEILWLEFIPKSIANYPVDKAA